MSMEQDELIPTRQSLLSRLKDWDDDQSWRDFFNTYWKLVYNSAIKAGLSDAEAQDVVQETVTTVAKKIKDLKYDPALGSFKGWLLNTTRWKISDQYRKRPPSVESLEIAEGDDRKTGRIERLADPASFDLDAVWDEEWQKNLMDAAMDRVKQKVSPSQYQIFDCHVVKGWPVEKIVSTLGVNAAQVYLAKHRVMTLIKKEVRVLEKSFV